MVAMGKNHHSDQRHPLMSTKITSTSSIQTQSCYLFHCFYVIHINDINIYVVALTLITNDVLATLDIYFVWLFCQTIRFEQIQRTRKFGLL